MNRLNETTYKFTNLNHLQILQVLEEYREKNGLTKSEFSRRAGYSDTMMNQLLIRSRFSKKSFTRFMNICNQPTQETTQTKINYDVDKVYAYTKEEAINKLKSEGIKILKPTYTEL